MGNLGARVSQQGYDVRTVADKFISFTSSAKTLKVFKETTLSATIADGDTADLVYTHNLGYYAPFIVVYNSNTVEGAVNQVMYNGFSYFQRINSLTVGIANTTGSSATFYLTVYQFLDPFDEYTSSTIGSGGTIGTDTDNYGIRISKSTKDVKTCADVDCVISSSYSSMIVHKIGKSAPATITHSLGYVPMFFSYDHYAGNDYLEVSFAINTYINSSELVINDIGQDYTYYVIFKNTY